MFKSLSLSTDMLSLSRRFWGKETEAPSGREQSGGEALLVRTPAPATVSSPIIGVLGGKGGVGATTIAINLAAALAAKEQPTILVDANLQQPDAAIALGQEQNFSLLELIERSGQVDENMLRVCSTPVSKTLPACRLLSPPQDGGAAVSTQLTELGECLAAMRSHGAYWVLDLPKNLDRHLVTMLDRCDRIVVVFEATLPSLSAVKRWLNVLQELGYPRERIVCVLNRTGGKIRLVEQQLETLALFGGLHRINNAYALCEQSIARGEPAILIQPHSAFALSIKKLAQDLVEGLKNG